MSLRLYMDHHVHAAITAALTGRGMDVITAFEDGRSQSDDAEVLERATQLGRVVFTQDEDFLILAKEWSNQKRSFTGIIYGSQLALTVGAAVRDLELACKVLHEDELQNQVLFLPL